MFRKATPQLFFSRLVSPREALYSEAAFDEEIRLIENHLRKLILRKNLLYAPISCLPDELFTRIFHFVQLERTPRSAYAVSLNQRPLVKRYSDPRLLMPILLVCRQWYDLAMCDPSLWAFFGSAWWTSSGARVLMERSKNAPLSCTIDERSILSFGGGAGLFGARIPGRRTLESDPWSREELVYLLRQCSRTYHIDLALAHASCDVFTPDDDWGRLLYARFAIELSHFPDDGPTKTPSIPIVRAQQLRALTLQGFALGPDPSNYSFPALEALCFRSNGSYATTASLPAILSFLSRTPRLLFLELEGNAWDERTDAAIHSSSTAILPRLRQIVLQGPRGHGNSFLMAAKYIVIPPGCSLSYSILPASMYFPPPSPPTTSAADLHETLSYAIPFNPASICPHTIRLTVPQSLLPDGVTVSAALPTADREAPLISLLIESASTLENPPYHLWSSSATDSDIDQLEQHFQAQRRARSEVVETLMRTCTLSSVQTLECSLGVLPDVWLRILSSCSSLQFIHLIGLTVACDFAQAIINGAAEPWPLLPALRHIEIKSVRPVDTAQSGWGSEAATPNEESLWDATLDSFSAAFTKRYKRMGVNLPALTIHRERIGCSMHATIFNEASVLVELGLVVDDLMFG